MASNTNILIKRSLLSGNAAPSLLKQGELAYSYNSNTLFIGTEGSDGYLEIGSYSNLTSNITGISGSSTYGSSSSIPKITVDKHGKVVDITTTEVSIATTLTVDGDSGSDSINLLTDTLTLAGGDGITSTASGTTVTFDVDDTVIRGNTAGLNQTIDGTLNISGNLNVTGTSTFIDTVNLVVEEPIIFLANNNTSGDLVDIGFAGIYNNGTANVWTGLIRHAGDSDKHYHLFQEYTGDANNGLFDIVTANAKYATLQVNELITGNSAVIKDTSCGSISFGFSAGNTQYCDAIAIGSSNVGNQQYCGAIAIGTAAGSTSQLLNGIAIGTNAGTTQEWDTVAIGRSAAGTGTQSHYAIAVGAYAGETCQGYKAISMGRYAGQSNQQYQAVAIGAEAGRYSQTDCAVAIGSFAGRTCQKYAAVAIGSSAGHSNQCWFAVSIGLNAGKCSQGSASVALGHAAGEFCQRYDSVAIGVASGRYTQGHQAVAIGNRAARCCQQNGAVAIGSCAGYRNQGSNAVAIGNGAGFGCCCSQGHNSIAIGSNAGYCRTQHNSIILNASGCNLNSTEAGFYVAPIRANNATGGNVATYNTTTKEVVYTDVNINNNGITLANGTSITDSAGSANVYIKFLQQAQNSQTGNIAYYDTTTGELVYGSLGTLSPDKIQSGSYIWEVDAGDGHLYSDQGTVIADSSTNTLIGQNLDLTNTSEYRVAVGYAAGNSNQGYCTVAIGTNAGHSCQYCGAIAIGTDAGYSIQHCNAIAIGNNAGREQLWDAVAVGRSAGRNCQSYYSVAIGAYTGENSQGYKAVAIGRYAGQTCQQYQSVAIGTEAGRYNQIDCAVAIGAFAGRCSQGYKAVAVGGCSGHNQQQSFAVAVGYNAGHSCQGGAAVALGHAAGEYCQGGDAVSIGRGAARYSQHSNSIAIGTRAGYESQQCNAVAIGTGAGYGDVSSQGANAIAIGYYAGYSQAAAGSIILNATGSDLSAANIGFFVSATQYEAVQEDIDGIAFFNPTTKEIRYSYTLDGGAF